MAAAFDNILQRHRNLRSFINEEGGNLTQQYVPYQHKSIPLINLEKQSDNRSLETIFLELANTKIDLHQTPLFNATLLRLTENHHVFFLVFQHLVFDAWSAGIFIKELWAFYNDQTDDALPELDLQWGDYTHWLIRFYERSSSFQTQLTYWTQQLHGELPRMRLPEKSNKPKGNFTKSRRVGGRISSNMVDKLQGIASAHHTTPFTLLLSLFKVLLYKYSSQTDLIVGTPVSGRNYVTVEPLIGSFLNMLALRTTVDPTMPFAEFLKVVRKNLLSAIDNQQIPFELLIDRMNLKSSSDLNPVFRVMFELRDVNIVVEDQQLMFKELKFDRQQSYYDLILTVQQQTGDWGFHFDYKEHCFESYVMDGMARHFSNLVNQLEDILSIPLAEVDILHAKEKQRILFEWNSTQVQFDDLPDTFHQLFSKQARLTPDGIALIFDGRELTYEALEERSNKVAVMLQQQGVLPGAIIGLCINRSFEMIIGMLAILKTGAAFMSIDFGYPRSRINYMIEDAGIHVLLTQREFEELFKPEVPKVLVISDLENQNIQTTAPKVESKQDDLAYLIYTSGSTAKPKGVMIKHESVVNFIWSRGLDLEMRSADRMLQNSSLSFDASIMEVFLALATGASLVLSAPYRQTDLPYIVDLIHQHEITWLICTPSWLKALMAEPNITDCQSLTGILVGGEELSVDLMQKTLDTLDILLVNEYGPTEGTIAQIVWDCDKTRTVAPLPIGKPIDNMQAYILNPDLQPVPIGVQGHLYLGGTGLSLGYFNKPEQTKKAFIDHPFTQESNSKIYHTGDLAKYEEDGNIVYLGRADHQVQIRGYRIEFGEIEHTLRTHAEVKSAVVSMVQDHQDEKRLIAYVVLNSTNGEVSSNDLLEHIRGYLPWYMVPSQLIIIDSIPLTANDKIDRKRLPSPNWESMVEKKDPVTKLQKDMAAIWKETLNLETIGLNDNFFEIGGDSLKAMRIISRVKQDLSLMVSVRTLFDYPQLETFVNALEESNDS